ncbi:hypothetical protein ONZ51_g7269 [Trametes cubensis]|uniref:Uncharacterized protein n=1 Tax=Trametes cubensis TaxID=1111947 RepID=A0AAD7TQT4_9APHY|nr:hypothetical protein ONZ51_g7269 [Trametes cubensis]
MRSGIDNFNPPLALNDDVLQMFFDVAAQVRALKSLSKTCRQMRLRCMPLLFNDIIHFLTFCSDRGHDVKFGYDDPVEFHRFSKNFMLCGVYSTDFLKAALSSMPRLHTVTLKFPSIFEHGLPRQPDWPRLRELRLKGELSPFGDPPLPFVAVFSNMPKLRVLELKLAQSPELRELTLSCPQVGDNTYAALPCSLQSLSLRCTPHYLNLTGERAISLTPKARWQWSLPSSSDMLRILRQCQLPDLRHLALEYREDDADGELLQHVASACPALRCLRLFRCQREDAEEPARDPIAIVAHMADQLVPLRNLTKLDLQLDLPGAPKLRAAMGGNLRDPPLQR